jgi:hypothetical protein
MPAAREYRFEQRSNGRGAVVRIGPTGGKRVINVYKDQDAAWQVMELLNQLKSREA